MPKNLFNRYIWIVDTIRRHGAITREELNRLWMDSSVSDGNPLPRRTFYNYRNAISELFKIDIECNPSTDVADRVFLEEVPSARQFLSPIISAMKEEKNIEFDYSPFSRTGVPKPVRLEPYFLKIFKLRWYITGLNVREKTIKTYALDRISALTVTSDRFVMPPDFDAEAYFRDSFGIVFTRGETKKVIIRATPRQAKYFRALPLHHTQSEMIHDRYSIFTYHLRLTPDFVQELLSHGPELTVLAPAELRAMMIDNLKQSLENYSKNEN